MWTAADIRTSFLCNLQVYTGKLLDDDREQNQGFCVVTDLLEPYYNSGRGITTDNFFNTVELANFLLTKNLTLLGTVRKNKQDTPNKLKVSPLLEHSSKFAFIKDLSMVSYIPKKGKLIHLLSSQHHDKCISVEKKKY